jgi:hypothetical protein
MTRTLRLVVVLMLAMSTIFFLQITDQNGNMIVSAENNDEPLTWDQLNQTIAELMLYIEDRIDEGVVELKEYIDARMSFNLSDGNTTINISFDDSAILSMLENETKYFKMILGEFSEDVTIYNQLASLLDSTTDKYGNYILRNDTGESMFKIIAGNQQTLYKNQELILDVIVLNHNGTRTVISATHDSIRNKIDGVEKNIIGNTGDGLFSILAGLGIAFLIVWIFLLKPRLNKQYSQQDDYYSNDDKNTGGGAGGANKKSIMDEIKSRNPLKIRPVNAREMPPDCFRDGVSFDPYKEPACNMCPFAKECEDFKLNHEAEKEITMQKRMEEEEKRKQRSPISHSFEMPAPERNGQFQADVDLGEGGLDF